MTGLIDFGTVDIELLLSDRSVQELLEIVDKHPMWKIGQMVDNFSNMPGEHKLTYDEAKTILSRLDLSTQSLRLSNISRVRKMSPGYKKAVEQPLVNKPDTQQVIAKYRQSYAHSEVATLTEVKRSHLRRLISFFSVIKRFIITFNSPYYLLAFFVIAGILYFVAINMFKTELTDVSLPVNIDSTKNVMDLKGVK